MLLQAEALEKSFRRTRAVAGVDLEVCAGERVALLGPNGAGKTTTLLMLLGAITPDLGWVLIDDVDVHLDRARALEPVGFAAGNQQFHGKLTAEEYVTYFARLYGVRRPKVEAQVALERFGVAHLAGRRGTELSAGQRTIVAIARATVHRPRLLVLDEPTAFLDPDVSERVRVGLRQLADDGTTLLLTSHNMHDIERICERVVFMHHGRVVADDAPEAVAQAFGYATLEEVFRHLAQLEPEVL